MTASEIWKKWGCRSCAHFGPEYGRCAAFPAGIPIEVASGRLPHTRAIAGDRGHHYHPADAYRDEKAHGT